MRASPTPRWSSSAWTVKSGPWPSPAPFWSREDQADDIFGAVLVFKDITDVHKLRRQKSRLAEELRSKHEELRQAYLKLEDRNKSLEEAQRRGFWIRLVAAVVTLCLFAALALVFSGSWARLLKSLRSGETQAVAEQDGAALRKFTAKTGDIMLTVNSSGFIEPLDLVTIASDVNGRITEVHVVLGQRVKKGQVLFKLDPGEVLPKVRQAESTALKAKHDLWEKQNWLKRPDYKQALRALELAQMDLERKKDRLEENQRLFKEGIIPEDDLENARSDLRRSQAEMAAAQERVATAKENGSPEKIRMAQLEYQNAVAALEDAKGKLSRTVVRSPADGGGDAGQERQGRQAGGFAGLGGQGERGPGPVGGGRGPAVGCVRTSVDEVEVRRNPRGAKGSGFGPGFGEQALARGGAFGGAPGGARKPDAGVPGHGRTVAPGARCGPKPQAGHERGGAHRG